MICSSRKLRKTKTEFLNILWLEELLSSNSGCSGFKILSGQTLRHSWPAVAHCTAEEKLCLNWKPFYCSPARNKLHKELFSFSGVNIFQEWIFLSGAYFWGWIFFRGWRPFYCPPAKNKPPILQNQESQRQRQKETHTHQNNLVWFNIICRWIIWKRFGLQPSWKTPI